MRTLILIFFLTLFSPMQDYFPSSNFPAARPPIADEMDAELNIKFWWWTLEEWKKGIEMTNPPPKKVYPELLKWEYSDMDDSVYPHEVDMIATFRNFEKFDVAEVRFFASARYSDVEPLSDYDQATDSRVFRENGYAALPWLNEQSVGTTKLDFKPGAEESTVSRELDLSEWLNSKSGNAQICGLRVRIEVADSTGNVVAAREKSFRVILGD